MLCNMYCNLCFISTCTRRVFKFLCPFSCVWVLNLFLERGFEEMKFDGCFHQKYNAWAGVEDDRDSSTFPAKSQPWLQSVMNGFGQGIRRPDSERIILWCNYCAAGVVTSQKHKFTIDQITQMCHANPASCAVVVLLPNRAADLRVSPVKCLTFCIQVVLQHVCQILF